MNTFDQLYNVAVRFYAQEWTMSMTVEVPILVSLPDLGLTYTSNTRNKSGDDCDELDADWMTVCQLFLEIYDTHNYRTQK